jgi:hypothetical protein
METKIMKTKILLIAVILININLLSHCVAVQNKEKSSDEKYSWQGVEYNKMAYSKIGHNKSEIVRILLSGALYKNKIIDVYYEITDSNKIKRIIKDLRTAKKEKYTEFDGDLMMFQYKDGTGAYLKWGVDDENEFVYGNDFTSKTFFKTFVEYGLLKQSPESVLGLTEKEKLILNVIKLERSACKSDRQAIWFARRLEKCLSELEKVNGLAEMPFNWENARGIVELQGAYKEIPTKETVPFYVPCPNVPDILVNEDTAKLIKIYSDNPEPFRRSIEIAARTPGGEWKNGRDEYVEYLEKRLKRLEEHLSGSTSGIKTQSKNLEDGIEPNKPN